MWSYIIIGLLITMIICFVGGKISLKLKDKKFIVGYITGITVMVALEILQLVLEIQ